MAFFFLSPLARNWWPLLANSLALSLLMHWYCTFLVCIIRVWSYTYIQHTIDNLLPKSICNVTVLWENVPLVSGQRQKLTHRFIQNQRCDSLKAGARHWIPLIMPLCNHKPALKEANIQTWHSGNERQFFTVSSPTSRYRVLVIIMFVHYVV